VCSEYVLHVLTEPLIDRKKSEELNRRLRPLPTTKKWAEAEILRGKAVDAWKAKQSLLVFYVARLCEIASEPTAITYFDGSPILDCSTKSERERLHKNMTSTLRDMELLQRQIDHFAAEAKRWRGLAWEQGNG
jgi:hypothetical protein